MLKRLASLCAATLLGGCIQSTTIQQRPSEGYEALRFRETVRLPAAIGFNEFPAGAVLVQDRTRERDGVPLWCGQWMGDMMCARVDGNRIGLLANILDEGLVRDLPPGSTEIIRLP